MKTMTSPEKTDAQQASKASAGLSPLNRRGAAVHHDLYRVTPDPDGERARLKKESRVLGLGFLVMFTCIIGGVSMTFNGAWKQGYAVSLPRLPYSQAPSEPPQFQVQGAGVLDWRATEDLDLRDNAEDDLDPAVVKDLTPIHIYMNREHVGTCYARLNSGETPASLRLPNQEPGPVRTAMENAFLQARLFGLLPTRYPAAFGLLMGVLAIVAPVLLIPFYRFWMRSVTAPLGWFNTRLLLGIVFYTMFTPIAVVLWIRRKLAPESDALRRQPLPASESYWVLREKQRDHKHFQRLF